MFKYLTIPPGAEISECSDPARVQVLLNLAEDLCDPSTKSRNAKSRSAKKASPRFTVAVVVGAYACPRPTDPGGLHVASACVARDDSPRVEDLRLLVARMREVADDIEQGISKRHLAAVGAASKER